LALCGLIASLVGRFDALAFGGTVRDRMGFFSAAIGEEQPTAGMAGVSPFEIAY